MTTYAGIGSRSTPTPFLDKCYRIGRKAARAGWTLRSGAADGADSAFEAGAVRERGSTEIYLPWEGFRGHASPLHGVSADAIKIAAQFHPSWSSLRSNVQRLMGRNVYQVLGLDLIDPVDLVICWTEDGCNCAATRTRATGGTGMAIALAGSRGIPVYNIQNEADREVVRKLLWAV